MKHFEQWLSETKKHPHGHKKKHHKHAKEHSYHCPGCGLGVFVSHLHHEHGPIVHNFHDDHPHSCPSTNGGVPEHSEASSQGMTAATIGAASAVGTGMSSGAIGGEGGGGE